jgi:hypothetical protein
MKKQGGFRLVGTLLLITVVVVGGVGLVAWKKYARPACDTSFKLGEVFTLGKGCAAKLVGADFEVGVVDFYNHPCPEDVSCIWSGQSVMLEYTSHGETHRGDNTQAFGYMVHIEESDYETFAKLSVAKP